MDPGGSSLTSAPHESARRERQQRTVTAWFDVLLSLLAVLMVVLIVIEFAAPLGSPWGDRLARTQLAIWAIFVAAFLIELYLAPSKQRYLREHWLVALSLALPLLRVFRVVRALRVLRGARAARGLTLARVASALNRGTRALRRFLEASQFAYLLVLTLLVTLASAAAALYFERGTPEATITSFGDAIWWAATVVSTVNSPLETVTVEGRIVAFGLRIFGVAVIGYLTARIAVFLLGEQFASASSRDEHGGSAAEVRALRRDLGELRQLVERSLDLQNAGAGEDATASRGQRQAGSRRS